MGPPS